MFEPKTFWEKRQALAETMLMQLINGIGAGGMLGGYYHQLEQLKNGLAQTLLGPNPVAEEERATVEYVVTRLHEELTRRNLVPFAFKNQCPDQVTYARALAELRCKLQTVPNLDQAVTPDLRPGLYHINANGEEQLFPAIALVWNAQLYVFVLDTDNMQFFQLSLAHMPEGFDWTDPATKRFWRNELFLYREDLSKAVFEEVLETVLSHADRLHALQISEEELQQDAGYQQALKTLPSNPEPTSEPNPNVTTAPPVQAVVEASLSACNDDVIAG